MKMQEARAEVKRLGLKAHPTATKEELLRMINKTSIVVGDVLENPETTEAAIADAIVHSTATDEQLYAKIEREEKEKLMREQIRKRLQQAAQIEENKNKQMNKYLLKYDIAELINKAKAMVEPLGGTVTVDKAPDGGLGYGFHIACRGKIESFPFAHYTSEHEALSKIRLFLGIRVEADMKRRNDMAISPLTGQAIESTVQFGDEGLVDDSRLVI